MEAKEVARNIKLWGALPCSAQFKQSEARYRCKTCETNDYSVLCRICFDLRAHQGHQVMETKSNETAYCGCGQMDNWKQPFCPCHHPTPDLAARQGGDVSPVARRAIAALVQFASQQLGAIALPHTWNSASPPAKLLSRPANPKKPFVVLVYFDETRPAPDFAPILITATGCNTVEAQGFVSQLSNQRRGVVFTSPHLQACLQVCQKLEASKVRCTVERIEDVFKQQVAVHFLSNQVLTSLGKESEAFRQAIFEELTFVNPAKGTPDRLDSFITADAAPWSDYLNAIVGLFHVVKIWETSYVIDLFGGALVRQYPTLLDFFLKKHISIMSLASMTIGSIALQPSVHHLASRCDFFGVLQRVLLGAVSQPAVDKDRFQSLVNTFINIIFRPEVQDVLLTDPKALIPATFCALRLNFQGFTPRALSPNPMAWDHCLRLLAISLSTRTYDRRLILCCCFHQKHQLLIYYQYCLAPRLFEFRLPVKSTKPCFQFPRTRPASHSWSCCAA